MSNQYLDPNLKVFSLNSNHELAEEIAKVIGVELGKCSVTRFSDGEIQINRPQHARDAGHLRRSRVFPETVYDPAAHETPSR